MEKRSKYRPRPSKSERQINSDLEEEKKKARPVRPVDAEKARERTLQRAVKLSRARQWTRPSTSSTKRRPRRN
ncbi:MAG: hypothetical protein LC802_06150 [Acidobacteria bacterium]|nr:hypothetical protein [Acidobacteriota bacterium]